MNLPNLIIPGAQKSATSTLVELLKTHSDIHIGELKEPHFFSKERKHLRGLDLYRSYYRRYRGQRFVVDASQSYMPLNFVPERIAETLGRDIYFIIVLRHPVDRVVSAFTHFKIHKGGEIKRDLADILPAQLEDVTLEKLVEWEDQAVKQELNSGSIQSRNATWSQYGFPFNYFFVSCYSKHIADYFKYFPKNRFLFLTFEQVTRRQREVVQRVAAFLTVDPFDFSVDTIIHANPSLVYRNRIAKALSPLAITLGHMLPEKVWSQVKLAGRKWLMTNPQYRFPNGTYQRLLGMFLPEIQRVERLTGLDLSTWKAEHSRISKMAKVEFHGVPR